MANSPPSLNLHNHFFIATSTSEDCILRSFKVKCLSDTTLSASERIGSCITKPGKFIGIGLNYSDHAAETGAKPPSEPIVFMKATSSINGPNDDIEISKNSKKLDWEVELGIVIGKDLKNISENE